MGYLLTLLARFLENTIISIGGHLTISVTGIFFLGIPAPYSVGAYAFAVSQKAGFALPLTLGITLACVLLVSFLFAFAYVRLSGDSFAVMSLASLMGLDALLKSWDVVTGGVLGMAGIVAPGFFAQFPLLLTFEVGLVAMLLLMDMVLLLSPFGRMLVAHKEDTVALSSLGISPTMVGKVTLILASVLASICSVLGIFRIMFLDPKWGGIETLLVVLTIAIIAQAPRVRSLLFSTLAVTVIPEILRFLPLPSSTVGQARLALYSLLVIILVFFLSGRQNRVVRAL